MLHNNMQFFTFFQHKNMSQLTFLWIKISEKCEFLYPYKERDYLKKLHKHGSWEFFVWALNKFRIQLFYKTQILVFCFFRSLS